MKAAIAFLSVMVLLAASPSHAQLGPPPFPAVISSNSTIATGSLVPRTLADRAAETFSPLDYGAKCDGVTDDTAAFQSMGASIARVTNTNVSIRLPPKSCAMSATLVYNIAPGQNFSIIGQGMNGSSLLFVAQVDGLVINYTDPLNSTPVLQGFSVLKNVPGAAPVVTAVNAVTPTTPVQTTLSAAVAQGAATFTVASGTGIQVGQDIVAAPGCKLPYGAQVAAVSGTTVTSTIPATRALPSGCTEVFETASFQVSDADAAALKTMLFGAWTRAQATQDSIGGIGAVHVVDHGSGYSAASPPTVTAVGAGSNPGSGAAFTPYIAADGSIAGIAVTAGGSGYEGPVALTISGGGGSGATAVADMGGAPTSAPEPFLGEGVTLARAIYTTCHIVAANKVVAVQGDTVTLNAALNGPMPAGCQMVALSMQHAAITITGATLQQEGVSPLAGLTVRDVLTGGPTSASTPYRNPDSWLKGLQLVTTDKTFVDGFYSFGIVGQGYGISIRGSDAHDTPLNPYSKTFADAHHFHNLHLDNHLYGLFSHSDAVEGIFIDQADMGSDFTGVYWSNPSFSDQITLSNLQIDTTGPGIQLGGVGEAFIDNTYLIHDDSGADYMTDYSQPPYFVARSESPGIKLSNVFNSVISNVSLAEHAPTTAGLMPARSCGVSLQSSTNNSGNTVSNFSFQGNTYPNAYVLCLHDKSGGVTLTGTSAEQGFGGTTTPMAGLVGYDSTYFGFQPDRSIGAGNATPNPLNSVCKGNAVNGNEYYDCLGRMAPAQLLGRSGNIAASGSVNPYSDGYTSTQSGTLALTLVDGPVPGHRLYYHNMGGGAATWSAAVTAATTLAAAPAAAATTLAVASATGITAGEDIGVSGPACAMTSGTQVASVSGTTVTLTKPLAAALPATCSVTAGHGSLNGSVANSVIVPSGASATFWWNDQLGTWVADTTLPQQSPVFSGTLTVPAVANGSAPVALGTSGAAGSSAVIAGAVAFQAAQVVGGSSAGVAPNVDRVIITGGASPYTLTAPPAPVNGQVLTLQCTASVAAVTLAPNAGQTVLGNGTTSCSNTQGRQWRYQASTGDWLADY
ncbi:MAG TPA: hypothetical protein VGC09_14060 [Rhodopila sp.]